jgi:hypothetical protein
VKDCAADASLECLTLQMAWSLRVLEMSMAEMSVPGSISVTRKREVSHLDLDLAANFSVVVDCLDWDVSFGNGTTRCYTCLQAFTLHSVEPCSSTGTMPLFTREANRMSRPTDLERVSRLEAEDGMRDSLVMGEEAYKVTFGCCSGTCIGCRGNEP